MALVPVYKKKKKSEKVMGNLKNLGIGRSYNNQHHSLANDAGGFEKSS